MNDENKRIVYMCPVDNCCKVVLPAPKALAKMSLEDIAKRSIPEGVEYRIIDVDKLPESREFRNAWTDENPTETVDVDIEKAKNIHVDRLRKIRDKKLKELDVEVMRAIEDADEAKLTSLKAKKKALRDMPANLKLQRVKTPEALSAVLPDELKDD